MKPELKQSLKTFLVELAIYGILVGAYFFLVLHFLGNWLEGLFERDRRLYAAVALGLILGQGVALESLTRWLVGLVQSRRSVS